MTNQRIKNQEKLMETINSLEENTLAAVVENATKMQTEIRVNGADVLCTVTPAQKEGRFYKLFYVNGKRTPKTALSTVLLAV
jgi:hypothetical protein